MKKCLTKTIILMISAAMALVLTLVWNSEVSLADNREQLTEEVEAYADLYQVSMDEVIAEGIRVGGIDIGGLTLVEAVETVAQRQQEMQQSQITLSLEGTSVTYTMEEMGLSFKNPSEEVVRAANLGKSGPLLLRYKENADMAYNGYDFQMTHYADQAIAQELIAAFAQEVNQEPIEAAVTKNGDVFEVTQDQTGIFVNEEATLEMVVETIAAWDGSSAISLQADAVVIEPTYTYEMLSTISDCLGSFKTICGDIDTNRGINVKIGAAKMDGAVILPGESYSVVEVLAPFDEANGYVPAVQYVEGRYDDSLGGGVCSLSTTLYNAVLRAELAVDKRWNHSMIVSYTDWGFDATVNDDGSRDLVFTNNYDTPIYIEAYVVYGKPDSWLHFNIYGKETRDMSSRQLVFYNNILECEYPTDAERTYNVDETLAPGEQVWDQGDYPYAVVEAYKEVWINGAMASRELLHTDTYVKSPAIIRHNPSTETDEPEPEPAS